jgi:hypothetical protein
MPRPLLSAIQIGEGAHQRGYPSWSSRAHAGARAASRWSVYGDSTSDEASEANWSAARGAAIGAAIGAWRAPPGSKGLGALRSALREGSDDFLHTRRTQRAARGILDNPSEAQWSAARGAVLGGIDGALGIAERRKPTDSASVTTKLALHAAVKKAITGGTAGFLTEKLAQRDDRAGTKQWYVPRKLRRAVVETAVETAVDFAVWDGRINAVAGNAALAAAEKYKRNPTPEGLKNALESMSNPYYDIQLFGARRASYV